MKIKQMNYESVTIVSEVECKRIEEAFNELQKSVENVVSTISETFKNMWNTFNSIFKDLSNRLNGKITKKRFIKLLQSDGIQRNTINELVKNNKEKYTYARYLNIVENLGRSTDDR